MDERPDISECETSAEFRRWYYLKAELVAFARTKGIQTSGGKFEIADRISYFLDHGSPPARQRVLRRTSGFDWHSAELGDETIITDSYRNTQNVRRYFKRNIDGFSFSIPLMQWMKANAGKTLADAVVEARRLNEEKRRGVKQPDQPHNQYNAYTRAYFAAVPGGTQKELRALWSARRKRPGPYVFDPKDLDLLGK
ncbi:MAG: DUF6434 domain-containing protein [Pseudomonadota bacterium]